jgi:hypothetical protein
VLEAQAGAGPAAPGGGRRGLSVSSRQQEKERRRQERLAREAEAERAARQRRVLGYAAGGVLGVAAVVAVVVAVTAGGGGDGSGGGGGRPEAPRSGVPIPERQVTELARAARAAGCTVRSFTPGANDQQHVNGNVNYRQNPPVFGPHNPVPASDGTYAGTGAPQEEAAVHALEHGRVVIWYRPSLPQRRVQQLETLLAEPIEGKQEGYKQLLVPRRNMPFEVAATAWGQQLGCPRFTDGAFDALRAFRATYVDKGPEDVPFPA